MVSKDQEVQPNGMPVMFHYQFNLHVTLKSRGLTSPINIVSVLTRTL